MALLDRVTTLVRANLNDLVEKAENPEKLLKQLLLDMQNQFLQVKTQAAMAIADQQLLEKKKRENEEAQADWVRKAGLAVQKNQEDLARVALERSLTHENASRNFAQQLEDQAAQVETLRGALDRLEDKMAETKSKTELLTAQHRRARLAMRTGAVNLSPLEHNAILERVESKVVQAEVLGQGHLLAAGDWNAGARLDRLDKADRVDRLLAELKQKIASD